MKSIDNEIFIVEDFISPITAKFLVDTFSINLVETENKNVFAGPGSSPENAHRLSGMYKVSRYNHENGYNGEDDIGIDLLTGICTNMEKTMSLIYNKHIVIKSLFYSHMKTGGKNILHIDNQKEEYKNDLSGILYLTDSYSGGNLYFPKKDLSFKLRPGTFITFIGTENLEHEVQEVTSGDRINLVCFFGERHQVGNV